MVIFSEKSRIFVVMKKIVSIIAVLAVILPSLPAIGQERLGLTLDEAIRLAGIYSLDAQVAKLRFVGRHWAYRSYKAELLPAINLGGNLAQFNRSMVETRNYETGEINYVRNNTLQNSLTLSIDQNIPVLGGTVSVQSYLYRLDQFDYKSTQWNTNPLIISYTQPLRTYNELKWRKKTEPKEYERAKRQYLESLQDVAIQTTRRFFAALKAQSDYEQSLVTLSDRQALYERAQKRFELTTINKSDLLQLELSLLNARVAVKENAIALSDKRFSLFSYLGALEYERVTLVQPNNITDLKLMIDDVESRAFTNSTHSLTQELTLLQSEQELAYAKSKKGLQMTLNSRLGLTKSSDTFRGAYTNLNDNEVIGITLTLPIFDWGVSKGKVKVAEANLSVAKTEIELANLEYRQTIDMLVKTFNNKSEQFSDASRALAIARERYDISMNRYEAGAITVTELNTAQQELEQAKAQYIVQLEAYWSNYYEIQKTTLYDYMHRCDLTADFDALVK